VTVVIVSDEGITLQNLKFLDDADLRELGFLMGPRKQLLAWSSSQAVSPAAPTISMNTTAVNPSAQVPLTSTNFQVRPSNIRTYVLFCFTTL